MTSTVTQTLQQMETVHSFVSYHGLADQKIRTMRSNWKVPNGRVTRSASFSDLNSSGSNGKTHNGYHSNGWHPPSNGVISEEAHTPLQIPRQMSYIEGRLYADDTIFDEDGQRPEYSTSHQSSPYPMSPNSHLRRNSYAGSYSEPKFRRRPSYKKYRSRKYAVKRIHPDQSPYDRPCELVERVLEYHYEEANDDSSSIWSRMVPVVMTWYMTFTEELYNSFKGDSTRHRFWMWLLACLLSTFMALALLLAFAFVLLHSVDFLVIGFAALVKFAVFVTSLSFVSCCIVLVLNYGKQKLASNH